MKEYKMTKSSETSPTYPYNEQEICFQNIPDNISLAGTLTIPKTDRKQLPAIVLIAGMGPHTRNYEMLGHKIFLVLADYLTRQGFAVLRFDKRGVGKSTGTFDLNATSKDLSSDVSAAIDYLKSRPEIDPHNIGLIGHSEGGMITTMIANKRNDLAFIVLLAGAIATESRNVLEHVAMQLKADGACQEMIFQDRAIRKKLLEIIKKEPDRSRASIILQQTVNEYLNNLSDKLQEESTQYHFTINENNAHGVIQMLNSPWYRYILNVNPIDMLKEITIPTLALYGSHDFVTAPRIIIPLITKATRTTDNITVMEFPHLNHWLQPSKTGAMQEYGKSKETIAQTVLKTISDWIKNII